MVASCLRGAFPPVDLLAVCLVLAIPCNFYSRLIKMKKTMRKLDLKQLSGGVRPFGY